MVSQTDRQTLPLRMENSCDVFHKYASAESHDGCGHEVLVPLLFNLVAARGGPE